MELVLVLAADGDDGGARARRVDVVVSVGPGQAQELTVGALQAALALHARARGLVPQTSTAALGLRREGDPEDVPPTARLVDSGLCDGDTVLLRPVGGRGAPGGRRAEPRWGRRGEALSDMALDVVGGPDSGTSRPLEPGALTVGRSPRCRLALKDPTLSRWHFSLQVADQWGGGLEVALVPDPSARNGVLVEGRRLDGPHPLLPGELVRAGDSLFTLRAVVSDTPHRVSPPGPATTGQVAAGGTGAQQRHGSSGYVTVAWEPRQAVEVQRRNLGGVRSAPSRQGAGLAAGRRFVRQRDLFYDQVEALAERVEQALSLERAERHAVAPDLGWLRRWAEDQRLRAGATGGVEALSSFGAPSRAERRQQGSGLAPVRLGLGDVTSLVTVGVAPGGAADLRRQAIERVAHHATVTEAPVTVDLDGLGAVGVWGASDQVRGTVGALVLQAASLNPPGDLVVAAALGEAHRAWFDWLKWLPHGPSGHAASPLAGEHVAFGPADGTALVRRVLDVVADRMAPAQAADADADAGWPRLLLVLDDAAELPRRLVDQVVGLPAARGVRVLWFGDSEVVAPRRCGALVHAAGGGRRGSVSLVDEPTRGPGTTTAVGGDGAADLVAVDLDGVQPRTATTVARRLAALRDADGARHGALPRKVPLLDVVELARPTPEVVADRWQAAPDDALPVAAGFAVDGVHEVDLVRHGPCAVVAGARGSGKTTALVGLTAALAVRTSPERLHVVVLDYGPGAGTEPLRRLPHTTQWVTASDGAGATREVLDAVQSRLSARAGGSPRVVLVVDDHAALARQLPWAPAILAELAGAGAHLVVASSYPIELPDVVLRRAGVRLGLRAPTGDAAARFVGSREPAAIPVPLRGRGHLRVGMTEPIAIQCPWPGMTFDDEAAAGVVRVSPFVLGGGATPATGDAPRTQLDVILDACIAAAPATTQR